MCQPMLLQEGPEDGYKREEKKEEKGVSKKGWGSGNQKRGREEGWPAYEGEGVLSFCFEEQREIKRGKSSVTGGSFFGNEKLEEK